MDKVASTYDAFKKCMLYTLSIENSLDVDSFISQIDFCPKLLTFVMQVSLAKVFMRTKFQVKIQKDAVAAYAAFYKEN